jgi:tripeptide aminopeptidase
MLDAMAWAASEAECDLQCRVENQYDGYRLGARDPQVLLAERALLAVGRTPYHLASGGGSDVNALLRNGFPAVNLCNAMTDVHTGHESIAVHDLELMVEVTLAIAGGALAAGPPAGVTGGRPGG